MCLPVYMHTLSLTMREGISHSSRIEAMIFNHPPITMGRVFVMVNQTYSHIAQVYSEDQPIDFFGGFHEANLFTGGEGTRQASSTSQDGR